MSKNTETSQAQQKAPTFDPTEAFSKMTQENLQRVQALYDELAAWEAKAYDRAKAAAEQLSEIATESVTYMAKLTNEWRTLTVEATRKGAEMFRSPRA